MEVRTNTRNAVALIAQSIWQVVGNQHLDSTQKWFHTYPDQTHFATKKKSIY